MQAAGRAAVNSGARAPGDRRVHVEKLQARRASPLGDDAHQAQPEGHAELRIALGGGEQLVALEGQGGHAVERAGPGSACPRGAGAPTSRTRRRRRASARAARARALRARARPCRRAATRGGRQQPAARARFARRRRRRPRRALHAALCPRPPLRHGESAAPAARRPRPAREDDPGTHLGWIGGSASTHALTVGAIGGIVIA